jgi:multidrug efflux pump subunit AcrA (membrane-fusion protein)
MSSMPEAPVAPAPARNGHVRRGRPAAAETVRRRLPLSRRWALGLAAAVIVLGLVFAVSASRRAATPLALPRPQTVVAPLTAHGVVQPVRSARVGTQAGGVVQTLLVSVGDSVRGQQELAVVQGLAGAEVLTAPFAGRVTRVPVHVGDTVLPGALIATVGDLSELQIETTDVDQYLVGAISPGQLVSVDIDALGQTEIGRVRSVALEPAAASSGATPVYAVTIAIPPIAVELRPGMTVHLTFTTD